MANRNRSESERGVKQSDRNNAEGSKKPFNKKKYREQKYSNKFKGETFGISLFDL